jgi:hypothetical protein
MPYSRLAALAFISCLSFSCSQSVVYSPSLNLSQKPLEEKEIDLQAGVGLLPETRPEQLIGAPTTLGMEAQVAYGFSDHFNLQVKAWGDVQGRENFMRTGYSLGAQFRRELKSGNHILIIPRVGMALNGSNISGYGFNLNYVYQAQLSENTSYYAGLGAIFGFRYLETDFNALGEERYPLGWGFLANIGLAWEFEPNWRLNFELIPIYQINTFEQESQLMLSPTVGFAYTIKP